MARFDYAYSKGITITAWVLQILACLVMLGFSAYVLAVIKDQHFYNSSNLLVTSGSIWIGTTSVTILLDIAEIILFAKKHLSPALYLSSACIKTFIWVILFVLSCVAISIIAIILCAVLFGTSLMQLIYTAKIVHRKRKGTLRGGNYSAANTGIEAGFSTEPAPAVGYASYVPGKPSSTSYASPSPLPAHDTPSQGAATEYYGGTSQQTYEMYGGRQ